MPAAAGTMVDILGPSWAAWLDLFRNAALIAIAPSLFAAGLLIQITTSTHQLLQRLTTPALLDTYERLRLYRMFREGESKYDPYMSDEDGQRQHDLKFDLTIVLNFYEGICTEILQSRWTGGIWRNVIYKNAASLICGQQNILVPWYTELTSLADEHAYPNIRIVAQACEHWSAKSKIPIFDHIPGPGNETTTNSE